MQSDIDDAALAFLLARAGLHLTDEQKAELKIGLCRHCRNGGAGAQAARPYGRTGACL